jgi:hypothetical protein
MLGAATGQVPAAMFEPTATAADPARGMERALSRGVRRIVALHPLGATIGGDTSLAGGGPPLVGPLLGARFRGRRAAVCGPSDRPRKRRLQRWVRCG